MSRPRLLDLFCGQGGASMGYHRAGFDVVGVDEKPQPLYPFEFREEDATTFPLDGFDAYAASPPCNDHSELSNVAGKHGTGWMLQHTIDRLAATGRPFVVENVARAWMPGSFIICGRAMGIARLKRHRRFLANFPVMVPPCACDSSSPTGVYGDLRLNDRVVNHSRRGSGSLRAGVETARALIGAPWMDAVGLRQAIPPVYTEHIGGFLLDHLCAEAEPRQ